MYNVIEMAETKKMQKSKWMTRAELVAETKKALKDPEFRKALDQFIRATS